MLLEMIELEAREVHLRRTEEVFTIEFVRDGEYVSTSKPPLALWGKILNRIKVMSRMVDYGSKPSTEGHIRLKVSSDTAWDYHVLKNPKPELENHLPIRMEGPVALSDE